MVRFLSREWFDELARHAPDAAGQSTPAGIGPETEPPGLVVEIAVTGAPEGEVRYQVVVQGDRASVLSHEAAFLPAQVELKSDYSTMAGIASGQLPALDALAAGQAQISGDVAALSSQQPGLARLDLLPPAVRTSTTF